MGALVWQPVDWWGYLLTAMAVGVVAVVTPWSGDRSTFALMVAFLVMESHGIWRRAHVLSTSVIIQHFSKFPLI